MITEFENFLYSFDTWKTTFTLKSIYVEKTEWGEIIEKKYIEYNNLGGIYFPKQADILNATDTLKQGESEFVLYVDIQDNINIKKEDIIIINDIEHIVKSIDNYNNIAGFKVYTLKYVSII
jgi:hypothetical protein